MTRSRAHAVLRLVAGLGAMPTLILASVASSAQAAPPERTFFTDEQTYVMEDLCDFPITVTSVFPDTRRVDFFDRDGVLTRTTFHIVEQDTFTANGRTLEGLPYRFSSVLEYDATGTDVTSAYARGLVVRVPLPDGSEFHAAGRVDFSQQLDDFVSVPDSGSSRNADAFCAALEG